LALVYTNPKEENQRKMTDFNTLFGVDHIAGMAGVIYFKSCMGLTLFDNK